MTTKRTVATITLGILICLSVFGNLQQTSGAGPLTNYYLYLLQTGPYNQAISYSLIIHAKDASNTTISMPGTITVSSSDSTAILPSSPITLGNNGIGSCTVYFGKFGPQTITVTDTGNNSITGTLTANVQPIHFQVSVSPTAITVGETVTVTVTALDQSNNILANLGSQGYGAAVVFESTDSQAHFPLPGSSSRLTSGTGLFNITLNTAGPQTITVINRDFPSIATPTDVITVSSPPVPETPTFILLTGVLSVFVATVTLSIKRKGIQPVKS